MSSLLVAFFSLVASSFRTRAALQTEILVTVLHEIRHFHDALLCRPFSNNFSIETKSRGVSLN
jgi:hypothetical protein